MKTLSAAMGDYVGAEEIIIVIHTYIQRSKLISQDPFWHSQKSVTMVLTSVYALLQYMQHTQAGLADTVPYNTLY